MCGALGKRVVLKGQDNQGNLGLQDAQRYISVPERDRSTK